VIGIPFPGELRGVTSGATSGVAATRDLPRYARDIEFITLTSWTRSSRDLAGAWPLGAPLQAEIPLLSQTTKLPRRRRVSRHAERARPNENRLVAESGDEFGCTGGKFWRAKEGASTGKFDVPVRAAHGLRIGRTRTRARTLSRVTMAPCSSSAEYVRAQEPKRIGADRIGQDILRSGLDHAGSSCFGRGEEGREMQIVCEDDAPGMSGPVHDRRVSGPGVADRAPVEGLESCLAQEPDPQCGTDSCRSEVSAER
jgi:hypothetical protein